MSAPPISAWGLFFHPEQDLASNLASTLMVQGIAQEVHGSPDEAVQSYRRAMQAAKNADDKRVAALISQKLAALLVVQGRWKEAVRHYEYSLEYAHHSQNSFLALRALNGMGEVYIDMESWREAETKLEEASAIATRLKKNVYRALIHINQAELCLRKGIKEQCLTSGQVLAGYRQYRAPELCR